MNVGTLRRDKAQLVVLRGWDPNGTTKRETVAPLAAGAEIMSGMVCSLVWNSTLGRSEFVKGATGLTTPHIAKYDWTDTMITSSGLFSALSCADAYELQTPYYVTSSSLAFNSFLKVSAGTPGSVEYTATDPGTDPATTIIGQVSGGNGPINVVSSTSNVTPDSNGAVNVLQFKTLYLRIDASGAA